MKLELEDEQQLIRDSVRRFVEAELLPFAHAWDEAGVLPGGVIAGLAELGLTGMWLDAEAGGTELGWRVAVLALEELARANASVAAVLLHHGALALGALALDADALARHKDALVSGVSLAAWAHAEPAGSEHHRLGTVAERTANGWVLSGEKAAVLGGSACRLAIVSARVEDSALLFVLPTDAPGLRCEPEQGRLGLRAAGAARLVLERVELPASARIANGVEGALAQLLDRASIGAAAISVGVGRAALEAAVRYANDRSQFGKPIAEQQAIQWKLADAAMELDAARLLVVRAAGLADLGPEAELAAAARSARVFASEAAVRAGMEAVQIFGGNGYIREYPVERQLRDAKVLELENGPTSVHRTALAAMLLSC